MSQQEFSLEKAFQTMTHVWDDVSFYHQPAGEAGVPILFGLEEIQTLLDDQIVKTQTMRGSPLIKPFEADVKVDFRFQYVNFNSMPYLFI